MIKRIQFGGISRTPSERTAADGKCAESINVKMMDGGDIAPVLAPKDMMSELGLPTYATQVPIYIHKTFAYTNYIAVSSYGGYLDFFCKRLGSEGESWGTPILSVTGGRVESITSIGNTLIILTDRERYYLLYKDGGYSKLGTKIPEPVVQFTCTEDTSVTREYDISPYEMPRELRDILLDYYVNDELDELFKKRESADKVPYAGGAEGVYNITYQEFSALCTETVWRNIGLKTSTLRADGLFVTPVLARYAVRLYSGEYIYNSVPILLGAGISISSIGVKGTVTGGTFYKMTIVFNMPYIVNYSVIWEHGGWNDIVTGVDIFLSTDINVPELNAAFDSVTDVTVLSSTVNIFNFHKAEATMDEQMRNEILSKANFYLVESIDADEADGYTDVLKPWSQDNLVVRRALTEDYVTHHDFRPMGEMTAYNQRLILEGVTTTIYPGHPALQSTRENSTTDPTRLKFKFYIKTESGEVAKVITKDYRGFDEFIIGTSRPYSFLCYPDPRCYKVEINNGSATWSFPMKEHPMLNIAYYYGGITVQLLQDYEHGTFVPWDDTVNDTYTNGNRLMMSEASNPFLFSAVGYADLDSEIIGIGLVTKPLSTGQFGQHSLYIFTAEGIYVIGIAANGIFSSKPQLVSRDVAIKGTVCEIEQAIVFTSEQGVMLIAGSTPKNISPYMNGRHYVLEADAADYLRSSPWSAYMNDDTSAFMAFIRKAKGVYDYAGRRIIFFSTEGRRYQYVYCMDTESWHKTYDGRGRTFIRALNNYPDSYTVEMTTDNYAVVMNNSTRLDASASQNALPGIIATRGLDLDAADVYKRIRRIRMRGDYEDGHVKVLLLGSADGRNYRVIHSLRGPSWKFFRLVVLTRLTSLERLSYAEIDYETVFTDRIR